MSDRSPDVRAAGPEADRAAGTRVIETSDMSLAGYFVVRGLRFLGAVKPVGQAVYRFADPDDQSSALAVEYVGSPESRYDAAIRSLKKVVHSDQGRGVFGRSQERGMAIGRDRGRR